MYIVEERTVGLSWGENVDARIFSVIGSNGVGIYAVLLPVVWTGR